MHDFRVGQPIHGYAAGTFGRDSYDCRRVESVGHDWVVTRNTRGVVETVTGDRIPTPEEADDRSHCSDDCEVER